MFRGILMIILGLSYLLSVANTTDEFTFRPNWKKGDIIHYKVVKIEETREGELLKDSKKIDMSLSVEVKAVEQSYFIIEFRFKNFKMEGEDKLKKMFGNDFNFHLFEDIAYQYKIDKQTGVHELVNWEKIGTDIENAFLKLGDAIEQKDPEKGKMLKAIMMMVMFKMKDKQTIQDIGNKALGPFFYPYQNLHSLSHTTERWDSVYLPFDKNYKEASKSVIQTKSPSKGIYDVTVDRFIDLAHYKSLYINNIMSISDMMVTENMDKDALNMELDKMSKSLDFELNYKVNFIYNEKTSWMTKYVYEMNSLFKDQKGNRKVIEKMIVEEM